MPLSGYRAFVIGPDGHVMDRFDLMCPSDEEAKKRAKELVDGHTVELWEGSRVIERFEPQQ